MTSNITCIRLTVDWPRGCGPLHFHVNVGLPLANTRYLLSTWKVAVHCQWQISIKKWQEPYSDAVTWTSNGLGQQSLTVETLLKDLETLTLNLDTATMCRKLCVRFLIQLAETDLLWSTYHFCHCQLTTKPSSFRASSTLWDLSQAHLFTILFAADCRCGKTERNLSII